MRKVLLFVCLLMAGMTVNVNAAKQKGQARHLNTVWTVGGITSVPKAGYPGYQNVMMTNGC